MNRFLALPASAETKVCYYFYEVLLAYAIIQAEENGLMAKLALHDAYSRFRADMFLSSLAESSKYRQVTLSPHCSIAPLT